MRNESSLDEPSTAAPEDVTPMEEDPVVNNGNEPIVAPLDINREKKTLNFL